jgi:hypothetical protein
MHSGKSPGAPKGNRNAFKYSLYSAEAMAHLGGQMPQGPFDPKMKKRRVVMQHADVVEVRSALHCMGFRYRLDVKQLPDCPDIVMRTWLLLAFT